MFPVLIVSVARTATARFKILVSYVEQVKGTQWEGGVRGVGVLWGAMLKNTPRVSSQLMHVTDWLPTLYTAAGGNLEDLRSEPLDGVDQWSALVHDSPSRRDKVLLLLDEQRNVAGLRSGHWKYVSGTVLLLSNRCLPNFVRHVSFNSLYIGESSCSLDNAYGDDCLMRHCTV
jgi:arylsulfatase A-like enzyme